MLSSLSSALLLVVAGVASAQKQLSYEPYLAPHEQRLHDALDNVNKDYNKFMKTFAKNAYCELTFGKDSDDITIKSGPCRDVLSNYGSMAQFKANWYPLTNTHPNHPERGVLSYMFVNYGLSRSGCEGLFYGTAEVKFNVGGQVTDLRGHSTDKLDFVNCLDGNTERRTVQEEIYLAPHEQDVYDAMDNIHKDYDTFVDIFADNAQCVNVSSQSVKSGPCKNLWKKLEGNMIQHKMKWMPVTNTHAKRPDKGVLAVEFWHYALTESGCEDLYGGTGTMTFNKNGLITQMKSYSNGLTDFMDCVDTISTKPKN